MRAGVASAAAALAAGLAGAPVLAQDDGEAAQDEAAGANPWGLALGLGGGAGPVYPGAAKVAPSVTPYGELTWRDRVTVGGRAGQGMSVTILKRGPFRLGGRVGYRSGRPSSAADALAGTDDIRWGAELGLSAGLSWFGGLGGTVSVTRVFAGPASGTLAQASAQLGAPVPGTGGSLIAGIRPAVTLADRAFMQPRFGIEADETTAANGYRPHRAAGGVVTSSAPLGVVAYAGRWQAVAFAGPVWPGAPARASPINRRSVNWQGFVAVGYELVGGD